MSNSEQSNKPQFQLWKLVQALDMELVAEPDMRNDSYLLRGAANRDNYNKIQILVDTLRDAGIITHAGPLGLEELRQGIVTENPAIKLDMQLKKHEFEILLRTKDISSINIDNFDRSVENAVKRLAAQTPDSGPVDITNQTLAKNQFEHLLFLLHKDKTRGLGKLSAENGVITITYPLNDILSSKHNMEKLIDILNAAIPIAEQGKIFNEKVRADKENGIIMLIVEPDYKENILYYLSRAIKNTQKDIKNEEERLNKIESRSLKPYDITPSVYANEVIDYLKDKIFGESGASPVTVTYQPASERSNGQFLVSLDNNRWKNNDFLEKLNSFLPVKAKKLDDTANDRINFSIEARPELLAAYFDKHDPKNFAPYKNRSSTQR